MTAMDYGIPPSQHVSYYPLSIRSSVNYDKFTYAWEIDNFGNIMDVFKNQSQLSSPIFPPEKISGVKWSILLYPNGENPECADDISVFLALQLGYPDTTIGFTITLLDAKGSTLQRCGIDDAEFQTGRQNVCWGFYNFYSTAKMRAILKDPSLKNTITIVCAIDYKTGRQDSPPKYLSDMADILESGRFSDITLICQGKEFKAHKIILASRSPVFSAMFEHGMKESRESIVEIPDIEPEIMKELLKFIYYEKVDNLEKHACSILVAATKYQIEKLMNICQKLMYENLSIENAVEMLILADVYNAEKLKSKAISFVVANIKDVRSTPGYDKLGQSHWHIIKEILSTMAMRKGEVSEMTKLKNVKCFTSDDFAYYPTQTTMSNSRPHYLVNADGQTCSGPIPCSDVSHDRGTMLATPTRAIVWQSPFLCVPNYVMPTM